MHFARPDRQVDTPQDDFVLFLKFDVQIIDFKHDFLVCHAGWCKARI
jgi:hypothetical protein